MADAQQESAPTPEEQLVKLREINEEIEVALEDHKTVLLNVYSILVKELKLEVIELANQLKKDPTDLFSRKTVYERLQQVDTHENGVFQLSNNLRSNTKKLVVLERRASV